MISDVIESRIAKVRKHRWAPSFVRELKAKILALVLADASAKYIGHEVDLTAGKACRWIHVLGFRRMYVTREERAHLMARRKATQ